MYIHILLLSNAWWLGARSNAKRGPGSLEVFRGVFFGILKLVGVTLVFIVCLGLSKYFHLLQTSMMGYLLTVLMSGNL